MSGEIAVTAEALRAGPWQGVAHLNLGSRGGYTTYHSTAFPEVSVFRGREKYRGGWKPIDEFCVVDGAGERKTFVLAHIDLAAAEITRLRQLRADDAAWDAANPERRSA